MSSNKKISRKAKILPQFSISSGNKPPLDLLEIQRKSFCDLLERGIIDELSKTDTFRETAKFSGFTQELELVFNPDTYKLVSPNCTPKEAILKGKTYACKLYVQATLTIRFSPRGSACSVQEEREIEKEPSVGPGFLLASNQPLHGKKNSIHPVETTNSNLLRKLNPSFAIQSSIRKGNLSTLKYPEKNSNSLVFNSLCIEDAYRGELNSIRYLQSLQLAQPTVAWTHATLNSRSMEQFVGADEMQDLPLGSSNEIHRVKKGQSKNKTSFFSATPKLTWAINPLDCAIPPLTIKRSTTTFRGSPIIRKVVSNGENAMHLLYIFDLHRRWRHMATSMVSNWFFELNLLASEKLAICTSDASNRLRSNKFNYLCRASNQPLSKRYASVEYLRYPGTAGTLQEFANRRLVERCSLWQGKTTSDAPLGCIFSAPKRVQKKTGLSEIKKRAFSFVDRYASFKKSPFTETPVVWSDVAHKGSFADTKKKWYRRYSTNRDASVEYLRYPLHLRCTQLKYPVLATPLGVDPSTMHLHLCAFYPSKMDQHALCPDSNCRVSSIPLCIEDTYAPTVRRLVESELKSKSKEQFIWIESLWSVKSHLLCELNTHLGWFYTCLIRADFIYNLRSKDVSLSQPNPTNLRLPNPFRVFKFLMQCTCTCGASARRYKAKNVNTISQKQLLSNSLLTKQELNSNSCTAPYTPVGVKVQEDAYGELHSSLICRLPRALNQYNSLPTNLQLAKSSSLHNAPMVQGCTPKELEKIETAFVPPIPMQISNIVSIADTNQTDKSAVGCDTYGVNSTDNTDTLACTSGASEAGTFSALKMQTVNSDETVTQRVKIFRPWIFLGELPLMTKRGHFILNGSPRVIVNQMARCPGIYFQEKRRGVGFEQEVRVSADLIPQRGPWLRIQSDWEGRFWARLKREGRVKYATLYEAFQEFEKQYNAPLVSLVTNSSSSFPKSEILAFQERKVKEDRQKKALVRFFKNSTRYSLGKQGRLRINQRVHSSQPEIAQREGRRKQTQHRLLYMKSAPELSKRREGDAGYSWIGSFPNGVVHKKPKKQVDIKENVIGFNSLCMHQRCNPPFHFEDHNLASTFAPVVRSPGCKEDVTVGFANRRLEGNASKMQSSSSITLDPASHQPLERFIGNRRLEELKNYKSESGVDGASSMHSQTEHLLMSADVNAIHLCLEHLLEGRGFTDDIDHLKNRLVRTSGKLLQQQLELGLDRLSEVMTPLLGNLIQGQLLSSLLPPQNTEKSGELNSQNSNCRATPIFSTKDVEPASINSPYATNLRLAKSSVEYLRYPWTSGALQELSSLHQGKLSKSRNSGTKSAPLHAPLHSPVQVSASLATKKMHKKNARGDKKSNVPSFTTTRSEAREADHSLKPIVFNAPVLPKKVQAGESSQSQLQQVMHAELLEKDQRLSNKIPTREVGITQRRNTPSSQKTEDRSSSSLQQTPFRWLRTSKPVNNAFREFFGSNPLSQYMDQTNPLAEITHKRRLSSMGPGGIKRETAGMEVRGIHPTHYGRVCPIETPEGKNAGLVNSPTVYGRIGKNGFMETPLYQVVQSQVQKERWTFLSAQQEEIEESSLATGDTGVTRFNFLSHVPIPVQTANNPLAHFQQVERNRVGYKALSPVQTISIATALIPFLEHDDANRALMGSNMQRQAIPLLSPERPIVGTGFEPMVMSESGQAIQATKMGCVSYVSANKIILESIHSTWQALRKERVSLKSPLHRRCINRRLVAYDNVMEYISFAPSASRVHVMCPDEARCVASTCGASAPQVQRVSKILDRCTAGALHVVNGIGSAPTLERELKKACSASHQPLVELNSFDALGKRPNKRIRASHQPLRCKELGMHLISPEPINPTNLRLANPLLSKKLGLRTQTSLHLCSTQSSFLLKKVEQSLQLYQRSNQETCLSQRPLVREGDWVQKGDFLADCSASHSGDLALGKNVTVAYMPWEGYNFEDAIVISDRLVANDIYTSIHIERYEIKSSKNSQGKERITNQIPSLSSHHLKHLDNSGIARVSSWVQPGDILVGKVVELKRPLSPYERLAWELASRLSPNSPEREKWLSKVWLEDISLRLPAGVCGRVINFQIISTEWSEKEHSLIPLEVHVYLAVKRKIQVGDKLAGRHGNKGIVSIVLPRQDMPYLGDGSSVDMVLNPLGVPSRMNLGQIFECLLGLAGSQLGCNFKVTPFDEIAGGEASRSLVFLKLYQCRLIHKQQWLFTPTFPGKSKLFDGRTGEPFENWVTVGQAYMLKLIHMVDHKIHARSTGPYSLFTRQPVRGRSRRGGQRLGEMEVWAVEGFGAAYTLQEFLTIKSDDLKARAALQRSFYKQNDVTLGKVHISPGNPEAFRVLVSELQALCLHIQM